MGISLRDSAGIVELVQHGIPSEVRGAVWLDLSGARYLRCLGLCL